MSIFTLWLLFVLLPNLSVVLSITLFVMVVASVGAGVAALFATFEKTSDAPKIRYTAKIVGGITLAIAIIGTAIPSKQDIMIITGGYIVTNTEGVEKLPANLVSAANKYLEEAQSTTTNEE